MARATAHRRSRKIGRPSAEDAAKLDDALLDTASEMFLIEGYARTTMDKIAKAARASTKTMYARYSNKAEVLAAVIKRLVDRTLDGDEFNAMEGDTSDVRNFLCELGLRFAKLASARQTVGINRLVIAEGAQFPELVTAYSQGPERARTTVRAALEHLQAQGQLLGISSPDAAATIFYDMTTSTPRMRALLGESMSASRMSEHVSAAVDIFLEGVDTPPQKQEAAHN